jgi:1-acyl-sn-glycerol-3-phosphate acyltransferase
MIATVRSFLAMVVFIVVLGLFTVLAIPLLILSFGKLRDPLVQYVGGFLGWVVLATIGVKLDISDRRTNPRQPMLYISNHSSTLDMFVILALRLKKTRFVAKHELQYNPFFFIIGRLTGQVFLQRQDREKAMRALDQALIDIREQGLSLYMAPEGTRKHEGVIGPFKKGAFHMALNTGYPICPIFIDGASELAHGGSLVSKAGVLRVTLNEEIDTSRYGREEVDALLNDTRNLYLQWSGC